MASVVVSVAVGVLTFGVGLLGLYLKRLVPERHMSAGSRDMIGAVIGLLSLLLALVLGTLVGSAYGFFATQKADIESLCARSLELDLAFRQYGPETQPLREALRDSMQEALGRNSRRQRGLSAPFRTRRLHVQVREVEPDPFLAEPALAGSNSACFIHGRELRGLPADPAPHVAAVGEPDLLAADRHRRVLGDAAVFWLRSHFRPQPHQPWRARLWLIRGGERDLFDPGAQPTVLRTLPGSIRTD